MTDVRAVARRETREEAFATVAGLLSRMGYDACVREDWTPPGEARPVTALVTCAPGVVVGMAFGLTAQDPEAVLPERSAKVARPAPNRAGDPLWGWF